MYKIAGERAEGLLFGIAGDDRFVGKSVKELRLRKGILIAAVVRGKTAYIPDGSFTLEENDDLVVISTGDQLYELGEMLQS